MYQAVIFDLDGVLCHTDNFHYLAWKEIATQLNIHFDETINQRLRGVSRAESFDIILEGFHGTLSEQEKTSYLYKKNEIYVELLNQLSPQNVSPDVSFTLKSLQKKNIKLAIGSSSKNAKLILQKLGIISWFNAISDGEQLANSKPHPEVFLRAASLLQLPATSCLVVEDAQAGVQAATAANMNCAAIGELTKEHIATYNLTQLSDLLKFV